MERRTFEDSFKDAFKDAEATPSDKVWTNVELELEKAVGGTTRRRLAFYQMLAAAAVTLALLSTGTAYFMIHSKDQAIERLVAEAQILRQNDNAGATVRRPAPDNGRVGAAPRLGDPTYNAANDERGIARKGTEGPASRGYAVPASRGEADGAGHADVAYSPRVVNELPANDRSGGQGRELPVFYTAFIQSPTFQPGAVDPVAAMMSKLAEQEMKLASNDDKKKAINDEKVWTSLGVAAGGFSAVSHSSSPVESMGLAALDNTSVPDKQSKASGVAYSMGLSFGTKVAPRWILQGGINYLTQSSNYVATNVIAGPNYTTLQAESINALGKLPALADAASADRLAPTVPYSVNNNLKYFSVPMQAGYLLVNQKFGLQLNAGISTDLFLENTITPEGGSLDKTTQSNGSESPYRTVNFSGLMGTELSYRLGQRYRIALNPALRYPINSVYKSDVGIESMPLTFDVGLRFRYIFK